jgi:hypothetical protein
MKADYATSDLISKVNSDWINEVLVNPELDCIGPGDHEIVTDLMLRPQYPRTQSTPRWREPAPAPAEPADVDSLEVQPMVRLSQGRSVGRRVAERLALAAAALALAGMGIRMSPGAQDVTNPVQATSASSEVATPINANELQPGWLLPEILYGPTMASSPISATRSRR